MGHVYRAYNAYCEGKAGSTPLERLREKRGGQAPRSYPFGAVGFLKPIHPAKWPGQRLVLCHFLGMRYVTGGGCLGYPFSVDAEGYREVIKGHSFKLKEPLQYVESLFPLLAGVRPQDFPEPRVEAPQAEQALPPPDFPPELDPPIFPREEVGTLLRDFCFSLVTQRHFAKVLNSIDVGIAGDRLESSLLLLKVFVPSYSFHFVLFFCCESADVDLEYFCCPIGMVCWSFSVFRDGVLSFSVSVLWSVFVMWDW